MHLSELVPDTGTLLAFEPEELGMRILKLIQHSARSGEGMAFSDLQTHSIGPGSPFLGGRNEEVMLALREAWHWLIGQGLLLPLPRIMNKGFDSSMELSRRALRLLRDAEGPTVPRSWMLPQNALHKRIREESWSNYIRGKYDVAIFTAMKAVEVAIREASNLPAKEIGVNLARAAFHPKTGPLTNLETEWGERDACSSLFAGALGSLKNPHSHRDVNLNDADEASEILIFASYLLRIIDDCIIRIEVDRNPGVFEDALK